ncbi:MAG TPA: gluconate:H+ symporter [Sporolactobacillaceae bacterium]|nr:gluconate:H+ symporter [Sporolactobacillaceae bacterium]
MSQSYLLLVALLAIFLLFFLIIRTKLHAFVALLLVSLLLGIASGMPLDSVIQSVEQGMGGTLGYVAVIVGLGAMFGKILELSGGAERLAQTLIKVLGESRAPLALGFTGLIVAIPVFFEVGLVILIPIIYELTKRTKRSLLYYGLPLLAGLSVGHNFIPPTPGPLGLSDLLGVNIGWVMLFGLIIGVPTMILAGPLIGGYIGKKIDVSIPDYIPMETRGDHPDPPSFVLILSLIFVPVVLILLNTFSTIFLPSYSRIRTLFGFLGHPFTALIITTLLSFYFLGVRRGFSTQQIQLFATKALEPVGIIILVIGAGGGFKQVLIDSGLGDILGQLVSYSPLPPILLAYFVAAGVRLAQGSSTVSMITAGGLIAPIISTWHFSQPELGLIAMSIASGATILSHVNDSGFWMINRYFGLSIQDTLKSWTAVESLISVIGLALVSILSFFVH